MILCMIGSSTQAGDKPSKEDTVGNTAEGEEDERPRILSDDEDTEEKTAEEDEDGEEGPGRNLKQSFFDEIITIKYEDLFPPTEKVSLIAKPKKPEIPVSEEPIDTKGTHIRNGAYSSCEHPVNTCPNIPKYNFSTRIIRFGHGSTGKLRCSRCHKCSDYYKCWEDAKRGASISSPLPSCLAGSQKLNGVGGLGTTTRPSPN